MELGIVGLGKMGGNMVRRLRRDDHRIVAFDLDEASVREAEEEGAEGAGSLEELVEALEPPRVVWSMVPAGRPTDETVDALLELLDGDDVIVDGANSRFTDSVAVAERCAEAGVHFLDAGVSGGVWGLERGYCMMIGGPEEPFRRVEPAFRTLAPEDGYARMGPNGAGHFVKMIHNAIEYAMLQALGEGFACLEGSEFELELGRIAGLWTHGAVVQSWLLELLARAFEEEGDGLERIAGHVDDSGTGRWTVHYAVENAIPVDAIAGSLFARFASRMEDRFSDRVIAALRNQFGGHAVQED